MRTDLIAAALRQLAVAIEAEPAPAVQAFYTSSQLPPGAASWRAARETAAREGIATVRVGRALVIDVVAWDAWLASRRTGRAPVAVACGDAATLAAMGIELPKLRSLAGGKSR